MTKQRVLVTGGAGFIGSHIAGAYLKEGYDVTVLDDLSSGRREHVPDGAKFVEESVDSEQARALLKSGEFTLLNHHAAQMDVRVSVDDPLLDARINILGLLNLLEGARRGGVRRVVFASSGGVVYGDGSALPHPEIAAKFPVSPYGVSKLASEYYLAAYAKLHGIEFAALRYGNVYGPRQNPHGEAGVVAIFCERLLNGESLTIFGDGTQTRDYVFVDDVVSANMLVSKNDLNTIDSLDDAAFNVGTGKETSVNELAQSLVAASKDGGTIQHAAPRPGELARSAVDARKLAEWGGWKPTTELAAGLQCTYDWIASCR